jgi:hypothetical protein
MYDLFRDPLFSDRITKLFIRLLSNGEESPFSFVTELNMKSKRQKMLNGNHSETQNLTQIA